MFRTIIRLSLGNLKYQMLELNLIEAEQILIGSGPGGPWPLLKN